MEFGRCMRWLAPAALLALAGAVGPAGPPGADAVASHGAPASAGGGQPRTAAACADGRPGALPVTGTGGATGRPAWYRLEPVLDAGGTLVGQRLTAGRVAGASLTLALPPESFASGPVGGRVLVGDDDGSVSHLRLLDMARGCWTLVARETAVIRGAVLAPDGASAWEHRVDRASRADLGVWRRPLADGAAVRALPGLAADVAYGPTFTTELAWTADGRLLVAACGQLACRTRVLAPATGHVASVDGTGPAVGLAGNRLVAFEACRGLPCPILAVDLATGARSRVAEADGPAALGGAGDGVLVYPTPDGSLATLALDPASRAAAPAGAVVDALAPVRRGSASSGGEELPPGSVLLAPGGSFVDPLSAAGLDPDAGLVTHAQEVLP